MILTGYPYADTLAEPAVRGRRATRGIANCAGFRGCKAPWPGSGTYLSSGPPHSLRGRGSGRPTVADGEARRAERKPMAPRTRPARPRPPAVARDPRADLDKMVEVLGLEPG